MSENVNPFLDSCRCLIAVQLWNIGLVSSVRHNILVCLRPIVCLCFSKTFHSVSNQRNFWFVLDQSFVFVSAKLSTPFQTIKIMFFLKMSCQLLILIDFWYNNYQGLCLQDMYLKIESINHRINNYLGMLKHDKQKIVAKTFLDRHYRNIHMLNLAKLSLPFWLRAEKFTL